MASRLTMVGEVRPVNYRVEETNLFEIKFSSGERPEQEKLARMIERNQFFSIMPKESVVRFVGRVTILQEIRGLIVYSFMVDNISLPRSLMKGKQ